MPADHLRDDCPYVNEPGTRTCKLCGRSFGHPCHDEGIARLYRDGPLVELVKDHDLRDWSNPWKLVVRDCFETRFASPQAVFGHFFGEHARWKLAPPLAAALRALLADLGVRHGPDPRRRSPEELEALPAGAKLSYHGQGETYEATKQQDGTWLAEGYYGRFGIDPPTMHTSEVKP